MDINSVLHFISSQIEKIIGVVAALFIATTALLIFRSIKEEKAEGGGTSGHGTEIGSIEDALRRVLTQTPLTTRVETVDAQGVPVQGSAPVDRAADHDGSHDGGHEKDERIKALHSALQKAQTLLKERMETVAMPGAAADPDSDSAALELKKEVDELRARLSEYEIIEDDIADLAMFKEENARLKQEVESLKTGGFAAPTVPSTKIAPPPSAPAASEARAPTEAEKTVGADPVDAAHLALEAQALADAALKSLADDEEGVEVLSNLVDTDKLIDDVNAADAEDLMSEFKDKGKS